MDKELARGMDLSQFGMLRKGVLMQRRNER